MSKPINWPSNEWLTVEDRVADAGPSAKVYFFNNGSALLANANECFCLRELVVDLPLDGATRLDGSTIAR